MKRAFGTYALVYAHLLDTLSNSCGSEDRKLSMNVKEIEIPLTEILWHSR